MSGKPSELENHLLEQDQPFLQENQENQRANPTRKNRSNEPSVEENQDGEPILEPSVKENQGQEPGIGANQKEKPAKRESHLGKPAQIETHQDNHQTEPLPRENHTIEQEPPRRENHRSEQPEPAREENHGNQQQPEPMFIENHGVEPLLPGNQSRKLSEPHRLENHTSQHDWYQMNLLCRSYLDIQQSRIALGHRNRLLFWEASYYLSYQPVSKENQVFSDESISDIRILSVKEVIEALREKF